MKVWKYHAGYVNISIVGKYPEKLMDKVIASGIPVKNASRQGSAINAEIPSRCMGRLRIIRRGSGCRVRVDRRLGAAGRVQLLRANAVFAVSLLVFLAALAVLSTRIWFIEVGSASLPEAEIKEKLAALGASVGSRRNRNAIAGTARALMLDPRIVNAKVTLRGVKLTVSVSGFGYSEPAPAAGEAAVITAEKDCVISSISVTSGRALVKPGDAVKKGDPLITGDLSNLKEGMRVPASGVVWGRVLYRVSAAAELQRPKLTRSGRVERAVTVGLFGREFGFDTGFEAYEAVPVGERLLFGPLPVALTEYEVCELVERMESDTKAGACERARLLAQAKLDELIPKGALIKTAATEMIDEGGAVTAVITVTASERIGIPRE
ncbi:MAG: sporulation protein YqfD [Clostridia bacterium]|nr:sporulation protein YqfD [Clostridia bacterium]